MEQLSKDEIQARVDAYKAAGSQRRAAALLGISQSALNASLKTAAKHGMMGTDPVLPGFRISRVSTTLDADGNKVSESIQQKPDTADNFAVPEGHSVKGYSVLLNGQGEVVQKWVKTRNEYAPEDIVEMLKGSFTGIEAALPAPSPAVSDGRTLTLYPLADLHMGLYAWGKETGTNWDLKIAEETIGKGIRDVIERSPPSHTAILLGGGDLLHSDNNENKTARSGNTLQVDGRYQKVLMAANRLIVCAASALLEKHEKVIVRILPGNHDEHSSVAVAYFLLAWFKDEPRIEVDVDPSLFFWHRFGKTFLGATHGHTVKLKDMAGIMAHRRAEDWGKTKYRYAHGFHIHHKSQIATEGYGVIAESHQTPTPQDAWHFGAGFLSGRSLQSITYHYSYGEISRVRVAMLDGGDE